MNALSLLLTPPYFLGVSALGHPMITLYQFESCPFCSKVRALLNHINVDFDVVEVSPFGMKELSFTDHKKVPVLKDDDKVITESATIIDS